MAEIAKKRDRKPTKRLLCDNSDSDDDFDSGFPAPQKAQPVSKLAKKKLGRGKVEQWDLAATAFTSTQIGASEGRSGRVNKRKSADELAFERELEEALKLSAAESGSSGESDTVKTCEVISSKKGEVTGGKTSDTHKKSGIAETGKNAETTTSSKVIAEDITGEPLEAPASSRAEDITGEPLEAPASSRTEITEELTDKQTETFSSKRGVGQQMEVPSSKDDFIVVTDADSPLPSSLENSQEGGDEEGGGKVASKLTSVVVRAQVHNPSSPSSKDNASVNASEKPLTVSPPNTRADNSSFDQIEVLSSGKKEAKKGKKKESWVVTGKTKDDGTSEIEKVKKEQKRDREKENCKEVASPEKRRGARAKRKAFVIDSDSDDSDFGETAEVNERPNNLNQRSTQHKRPARGRQASPVRPASPSRPENGASGSDQNSEPESNSEEEEEEEEDYRPASANKKKKVTPEGKSAKVGINAGKVGVGKVGQSGTGRGTTKSEVGASVPESSAHLSSRPDGRLPLSPKKTKDSNSRKVGDMLQHGRGAKEPTVDVLAAAKKSPAVVLPSTPQNRALGIGPAQKAKIPAWTPPAQLGKSHRSPHSPAAGQSLSSPIIGLRVGLSRNIKVSKPLHSSVKNVN